MKGQTHGGKGSVPRSVDKEKFNNNFDAIFRKTFKDYKGDNKKPEKPKS